MVQCLSSQQVMDQETMGSGGCKQCFVFHSVLLHHWLGDGKGMCQQADGLLCA